MALLLLVVAVVNAIVGLVGKKEFTAKDRKIAIFGLIGTHTQLLIGLILYFVSPLGFSSLGNMADKALRLNFFGASFNEYYCYYPYYSWLVKA